MIELSAFKAWLDTAAPGDVIIWHEGFLARERKAWREPQRDAPSIKHTPIAGLDLLAKAVSKAAESGVVAIVQRRTGRDCWAYVAVKSMPPAARSRGYSVGRRIVPIEQGAVA